jgi:hypothetical protein
MTEQTSRKRKFEQHIPEEVREHARAAHEEMHKSVEGLFPPEFKEHRHKARKEMMLAFRGLIDFAIQRMDEPAAKTK